MGLNNYFNGTITVIGYGVHGKKHIKKHIKQGSDELLVVDSSKKSRGEAEKKGIIVNEKLLKPKNFSWLVDICTWNNTHAFYIIEAINLGASVILVEKPATSSIEEAIYISKLSKEKLIPVFVSEHYFFSPGLKYISNLINLSGDYKTNIYIELSKNRKNDFLKQRGGEKLRFVDIELPHAIALIRKILSLFEIGILDYENIMVSVENEYSINAFFEYKNININIKCNLLSEKTIRILNIVNNGEGIKLYFDLGGNNSLFQQEIVEITNKEDKDIFSDNLDVLIGSVKSGYNERPLQDRPTFTLKTIFSNF